MNDIESQFIAMPDTVLREAIKADDVNLVKSWVKLNGWSPRCNDSTHTMHGKSALALAAAFGARDCVPFLWSLTATDPRSASIAWSATETALLRGHAHVAKALMDSCPKRNPPGEGAVSWLACAAMGGDIECFELALREDPGGILQKSGPRAITPLMASFAGNSIEMLRRVLPLSDPTALDAIGRDALMFAAECYWEEGMREIMPLSNPLASDHQGMTALMHAALIPSAACVGILLEKSDPLAKSHDGLSVLELIERASERVDARGKESYAEVASMIGATIEARAIAAACMGSARGPGGPARI